VFIVFLEFASHRERASAFMAEHKAWLEQGIGDRVFLLAGSLPARASGVILAHGLTREALEGRLNLDPFVEHEVVTAEVTEVEPSRVDERVALLDGGSVTETVIGQDRMVWCQ
jgi:uncharacterized protein YciI